jgi:hypothetical protein
MYFEKCVYKCKTKSNSQKILASSNRPNVVLKFFSPVLVKMADNEWRATGSPGSVKFLEFCTFEIFCIKTLTFGVPIESLLSLSQGCQIFLGTTYHRSWTNRTKPNLHASQNLILLGLRWAVRCKAGLPVFSWYKIITGENIPTNHKIYQKATKYTKWPINTPTSSIAGPIKIYPNWDFGLKICHLSTVVERCNSTIWQFGKTKFDDMSLNKFCFGQRPLVPLLLLSPPFFQIILFLSTGLLTKMTSISMHM